MLESAQVPGRLLRLRKFADSNPSTLEIYEFYERAFKPTLAPYLLEMELVSVQQALWENLTLFYGLKYDLNGLLIEHALYRWKDTESISTEKYNGITCFRRKIFPQGQHGGDSINSVCVEFKPKWLAQSPNAPPAAKRCRTCALRAMRGKPQTFCPLDLASGVRDRVQAAVEFLLPNGTIWSAALVEYFTTCPVLQLLKELQQKDNRGILNWQSAVDEDFLIAMAARDCTMFVEILDRKPVQETDFETVKVENDTFYVRCKLTDLDLKNDHPQKRQYWASIEKDLQPYYIVSST